MINENETMNKEIEPEPYKDGRKAPIKLTEEQELKIVELYKNGMKISDVVNATGANQSRIYFILNKYKVVRQNQQLSESLSKGGKRSTAQQKAKSSFAITVSGIKVSLNLNSKLSVTDINVTDSEISLTVE